MFVSLLKKSRDLLITSVVFGSALYGYIYYQSQKNKVVYLQALKSDTLKDASRLSNDSFGISWGFQADDTIMSRIDSGDLLFLRFECSQCISPHSMINCYLKTSHYIDEEFHSVGCAYRDQTGLYVLYNEFGQTKVKNYCQLVSLPYIKSLTLQKRGKNLAKIHLNLRKQLDFDRIINESQKEYLSRVNRLLGGKKPVVLVQDFLTNEQQINIRTQTNNTLRSL